MSKKSKTLSEKTVVAARQIATEKNDEIIIFQHESDNIEVMLKAESQFMASRFAMSREMAITTAVAIMDLLRPSEQEIINARPGVPETEAVQ
ncbi:hypothetical protein [uncultured Parasutterella sp.]|uniref:hypothetical protein n=1 Tax=uncultured Parasutterella sp. TaxID=1263098 RepID=UPI002620D1EC|nr:hypothetical protein [uncultured Parasutterella sp.]